MRHVPTVRLLALVGVLSCGGKRSPHPAPGPRLTGELEAELAAVQAAPLDAIGNGGKSTLPYVLRRGDKLALAGPDGVARLLNESADARLPRAARLAMLQILGYSTDGGADAALIQALNAPVLRPLAAYLLGRARRWGYPERPRDRHAILRALRPHLEDATTYDDPWRASDPVTTGDLALAAFVAVAGPARFVETGVSESIGLGMPHFDAPLRAALVRACKAVDVDAVPRSPIP
ncbi:MAG: hypothetical protein IT370_19175 [Deltaproteobacteria bacterium]|nr:hypothetical protein [Deltaproteobacteria bacterium]